MITSTKNDKVKEIKALQGRAKTRREAGAFVVEGVRLAEEAWKAGYRPRLGLYTEGSSERGQELIKKMQAAGVELEEAAEHVLAAASETKTPQGILLVLPLAPLPQPKNLSLVLIADQISDPGNLGTLLRSAAAAGVQAVWMTPGSVDAYAPKVLRGGMGAHFRLSVQSYSPKEIVQYTKSHNLQLYTAAAGAGKAYTEIDLTQPCAVVIGGEAHGATPDLMNAAQPIHIPMPGGSESLNAGVAGAVVLFEAVRQRNNP